MTVGPGEKVGSGEISDADLVVDFRVAKFNKNIPERDRIARQIMARILERADRTDYSETPLPNREDGTPYLRRDGLPATLLDYLSVAVDNDHGQGGAEFLILRVVGLQPDDPDYAGSHAMMQEYIDINMLKKVTEG